MPRNESHPIMKADPWPFKLPLFYALSFHPAILLSEKGIIFQGIATSLGGGCVTSMRKVLMEFCLNHSGSCGRWRTKFHSVSCPRWSRRHNACWWLGSATGIACKLPAFCLWSILIIAVTKFGNSPQGKYEKLFLLNKSELDCIENL